MGENHSEDPGIDGNIIVKWKKGVKVWTDFIWLRIRTSGEAL
jgi:hypothetical protein